MQNDFSIACKMTFLSPQTCQYSYIVYNATLLSSIQTNILLFYIENFLLSKSLLFIYDFLLFLHAKGLFYRLQTRLYIYIIYNATLLSSIQTNFLLLFIENILLSKSQQFCSL